MFYHEKHEIIAERLQERAANFWLDDHSKFIDIQTFSFSAHQVAQLQMITCLTISSAPCMALPRDESKVFYIIFFRSSGLLAFLLLLFLLLLLLLSLLLLLLLLLLLWRWWWWSSSFLKSSHSEDDVMLAPWPAPSFIHLNRQRQDAVKGAVYRMRIRVWIWIFNASSKNTLASWSPGPRVPCSSGLLVLWSAGNISSPNNWCVIAQKQKETISLAEENRKTFDIYSIHW